MSSRIARTVLVTGGTGALGGAVTRRLLDDGHRVAVTWVVKEEAEALRESIGETERLMLAETDVTDPASIAETVEDVRAELGAVEVLVHLVGAWKGGEAVHEVSLDTWDRMLDLNLRSALLCSQAVLPSMRNRGWGRVVLVSSRTAREDRAGQAAYAIAKAGVAVLAETIAEENTGLDVTANVVAPSTLDTPANRAALPDADFDAWVPPDDVAASVSFLTSQEAGQLRGAWLPVYGSA
ncbi:MAG: SDR family NAD(P)-dependent oxidoreductase [Actinomycetota bacterium]|nr:SDR family NAD(P)-dependent oxidoreductase [Actinomycetota bacterium]